MDKKDEIEYIDNLEYEIAKTIQEFELFHHVSTLVKFKVINVKRQDD